jgi:hypothetical protein
MIEKGRHLSLHQSSDPFRRSLMGRPVWARLMLVMGGLALFWLAVGWAVAVP